MAVPPSLRADLRPGDLGWVVRTHGLMYAREYGFDVVEERWARPLLRP